MTTNLVRGFERAGFRPAAPPSSPQSPYRDSRASCRFPERFTRTERSSAAFGALVRVLILRSSPSAIVGRVRAVVVLAIDRMLRRGTVPHITKERFERGDPLVADRNPARTVPFEVGMSLVQAALFHRAPSLVLGSRRKTVPRVQACHSDRREFFLQTTATPNLARAEGHRDGEMYTATVAQAFPARRRGSVQASGSLQDAQPSKPLADEINARASHTSIFYSKTVSRYS